MTSTTSTSSLSSSFLSTDIAISLATFGLVTAIFTTLERRQRKRQEKKEQASAAAAFHQYPYHPPERIVGYLHANSGKKWTNYSIQDEKFVRACPKVELHVHLDGSLDPDFLWRCWKAYDSNHEGGGDNWISCLPVSTTLPWDVQNPLPVRRLVEQCQTVEEFHELCTCRRGQRSLQHMLTCFEIFLPLVRGAPPSLFLLEELAHDFCRRQWEQNVVYTEVRYNPHLLMNETKTSGSYDRGNSTTQEEEEEKKRERLESARRVMQAVARGLRRGCAEFGIVVNQILCAINFRPDFAWDVLELAQEFRHEHPCGVVGIDIAAGEEHFDADSHPELYQAHFDMMQEAQTKGIPVAVHAGETPNSLSHVQRAASPCGREAGGYGARRIGHGYKMVESIELMQQLARSKIHVEICPTSSVETGGWVLDGNQQQELGSNAKPWKDHPGLKMMQHGISISFNSDDPAVFHTSLTWQYRIALAKMGLTPQQIVQTNLDAIEASFGRPEDKAKIEKEIRKYLDCLLLNKGGGAHNNRFTDRVRDPF